MTTALALRAQNPKPKRVLLGDAGAIPYLSDLPALDIIGLGGYHDLPFARASRLGMGAIVELVERMPNSQRPDTFAIYPTWWGDLPSWFGQKRLEVPVRGNVICGGAAKVVYAANWQPLEGSGQPFTPLSGLTISDTIDFADVVSERAHRQRILGAPGYVVMKLLDNPKQPNTDLWDAGRAIPSDAELQVNLDGLQPNKPLVLLLRLTATPRSQLQISADGAAIPAPQPRALDGWEELQFTIVAEQVTKSLLLQLRTQRGEVSIYHLWAAQ
jgi:hypothetical protein